MSVSSAPVQQVTQKLTTASPLTLTLPGDVTAGNALILVGCSFVPNLITAVSGGVTWEKATAAVLNVSGNIGTAEIWYGLGSTGGSGVITVTVAGSGNQNEVLCVSEWSGVTQFDVADFVDHNTSDSPTVDTPSITPVAVGELIIAAGSPGFSSTAAATSPFAGLGTYRSAGGDYSLASYYVDSADAAISTSWTMNGTSNYCAAIAAFGNTAPPIGVGWADCV